LTWAQAATDTRVKSDSAFANFIVISLLASQAPDLQRSGAPSLIVHYHYESLRCAESLSKSAKTMNVYGWPSAIITMHIKSIPRVFAFP
jgi:hypothetical protein